MRWMLFLEGDATPSWTTSPSVKRHKAASLQVTYGTEVLVLCSTREEQKQLGGWRA
jgi:hypothetical protein